MTPTMTHVFIIALELKNMNGFVSCYIPTINGLVWFKAKMTNFQLPEEHGSGNFRINWHFNRRTFVLNDMMDVKNLISN